MFSESVETLMWINIYVCYPLTLFVISMCCAVRVDRGPIIYYINLLFLHLINSVSLILYMAQGNNYYFGLTVYKILVCCILGSLYFRMIIALERCFFISRPQLLFIRQTKGFVTICSLVWVFCAVICTLWIVFSQLVVLKVAAALPGLVFIICLVLTLRSLRAATSVSTEEKRRIVATLFLLLIIYAVMNVPMIFTGHGPSFNILPLFFLSPYMDLIVFVVMHKGLIDKLLVLGTSKAQTDQPTDRNNESQEEESKM